MNDRTFLGSIFVKNILSSTGRKWKIEYDPTSRHGLYWTAETVGNRHVFAKNERELLKEIEKKEAGWAAAYNLAREFPEWHIRYEHLDLDHFHAERGWCEVYASNEKGLRKKITAVEERARKAEQGIYE